MNDYNHIQANLSDDKSILRVKLYRPEAHNALSPQMMKELRQVFRRVQRHKTIRVIVLSGSGKSFCAGADLNRMRSVAKRNPMVNYFDSLRLGRLFRAMEICKIPIIAKVHGKVFGGGVGLMAVCDQAIVASSALFRFSEVRLGIAPSNILKYVIQRIGVYKAYDLIVRAVQFNASEAKEMGLADRVVTEEDLDDTVDAWIADLFKAAPEAVREIKRLKYRFLNGRLSLHNAARSLAKLRSSSNGEEGIRAFFDKRLPKWRK